MSAGFKAGESDCCGGINNKCVLTFFKHYVKSEYIHSDKILISSRSFENSILEYGDYKDKIVYYPNGVMLPAKCKLLKSLVLVYQSCQKVLS